MEYQLRDSRARPYCAATALHDKFFIDFVVSMRDGGYFPLRNSDYFTLLVCCTIMLPLHNGLMTTYIGLCGNLFLGQQMAGTQICWTFCFSQVAELRFDGPSTERLGWSWFRVKCRMRAIDDNTRLRSTDQILNAFLTVHHTNFQGRRL